MPLKADNAGRLTGTFRVPAGIPVGTKSVILKGTNSSAQSIYRAEGWKTTETWGRVETTVTSTAIGVDPQGQIITLPYDAMITGVDIWPVKLGDSTKPIIVQLRGVEAGVPSQQVFAEKRLVSTDLKTGQWLPFNFSTPVLRRSDTPFAIVVLTEDANHAIAIAQLGGFDDRPGKGFVTGNPYGGGPRVDSAEALTWLAHPGEALTFRLRAVKVAEKTKKLTLGIIAADKVSDLMTFMTAVVPEGTAVELEFVMPSGQRYTTVPESSIELPEYVTGDITLNVTMTGTDRMTPILLPEAQIIAGTIAETANYVARFMGAGADSQIKTVFATETPGNSGVSVRAHTGGTAANPVWTDMPLFLATPLGDGKTEKEHRLPVNCPDTRFEITLSGGPSARPRVSSLTGVVIPKI